MLIGYARVSTDEQSLSLQREALTAAGCARLFEDQAVSGTARARPGLDAALAVLASGDVLAVWKLDRLGRSLPHLIETIAALGARGVGFRSLTEDINTGSAGGRLIFHIMGALAEFERSLIVERTRAGMRSAKGRGVHVGRKPALSPHQVAHARLLLAQGQSAQAIARSLKVGRSTLYRALGGT